MKKKGINYSKKIRTLLYRSFDGELKEKERKFLEKTLESSEELRRKKEDISHLRQAVADSTVKSFKPFFAERLMKRIVSAENKKEDFLENFYLSLKPIFKRLALVCSVIMLVLILYNLKIGDALSSEEVFYASEAAIEEIVQAPLL